MSDSGKLRPYNFEPRKKRQRQLHRSTAAGGENDEAASSSSRSRCQSSPSTPSAIESTSSSSTTSAAAAQDRSSDRVGSVSWCSCSHCQPMDQEVECLCCHEISAVENFILEREEQQDDAESKTKCVTLLDDFRMCCLSKTVLEMANVMQRCAKGYTEAPQQLDNRMYRFTAYKSFTAMIHKTLGKRNRRVIPSCCVSKIRETYPDNNGHYTGFRHGQVVAEHVADLSI